MDILVAFLQFALSFVPFILVVAVIIIALWAATKLFPSFGAWCAASYDTMMGVDAEYDRKYLSEETRTIPDRETSFDTYC